MNIQPLPNNVLLQLHGYVCSVIPAAATSAMRCMEHHYCVRWADRSDSILAQSQLTIVSSGDDD